MDAARWTRAKALFADAIDLPPGARAAFLAGACPDDPALRDEVAALLAEDEAAASALEPLAEALTPARPVEPAAPLRVGPWRLVREIGRGGMGTVFLAERADGQYRQQAALKLIRTGAASAEAQRRFRAERQILARLSHPHIARLLDGGVTPPAPDAPDGLPYFVMEYVEGEPLLAFCDARRLGLEARLALFLDVCDAVQAAHQALVVHRDLKPSNVLVAEEEGGPQVKLLDFGIAKLLDPATAGLLDDAEGVQTIPGVRALTPAYAAPEQVRGEPVTTATDVYALGLLLYELLTGRRPFEREGRTPSEVERARAQSEPPRPSTALTRAADRAAARGATPAHLARRLRGDLDTIVLKALRAEPARRYATAAGLADDLRRFRDHLPVRARPDAWGYRAGRFVRRHRVGVAAAALVALAVLGGAGASAWQAGLARAEARRAEATLTFLQTTLYAAEPVYGTPDATIRQALDSASAHVDRDLAEQPLAAAGVHSTLGYTYYSLGLYDRAERHQRRAAALYARAGRRYRFEHGTELQNLALSIDAQGRSEEALGYLASARPLLRPTAPPDRLASLYNAHATTLDALGRYDEAERLYLDAVALWRRTGAPELPLALNNLAVLYEATRRTPEAVPLVEEAARALRRGGRVEAARLGPILTTLGTLFDYTGRPGPAADTLDAAIDVLTRTLGPDHPRTTLALASRALVDVRAGRPGEALPRARDAFARARRTLPDDDPVRAHAATILAEALCTLAPDSARAGERLATAALDARRALYGDDHYLTATTESVLGSCLAGAGRPAEAAPLLTHAYRALRHARGEADARTRDARARLAARRPAALAGGG